MTTVFKMYRRLYGITIPAGEFKTLDEAKEAAEVNHDIHFWVHDEKERVYCGAPAVKNLNLLLTYRQDVPLLIAEFDE